MALLWATTRSTLKRKIPPVLAELDVAKNIIYFDMLCFVTLPDSVQKEQVFSCARRNFLGCRLANFLDARGSKWGKSLGCTRRRKP